VAGVHASGSGGISELQNLPANAHAAIAGPLAHAFASTFVWALVLLIVAFIPAAAMALSGWRSPAIRPVGERPLVVE
jgi:DMSO/TMAO reductase YedYZ heme-binding membrane subunit